MPSGMMIPTRNMPPMLGGAAEYGSSSLSLGQPNMFDDHNQQLLEMMNENNSQTEAKARDIEDFDGSNKSGSENYQDAGASGDDDQDNDQNVNGRKRKKRYNRHTQHQIQEMESFFKECPHPDDKQRKELARELNLEPLQVKFWFQNKRTQVKNQHERVENSQLRAENERLRTENMRYKEALSTSSCPACGGPTTLGEMSYDEHNLRLENARLREEIDRISGIAAKYVGRPISASYPPEQPTRSLDLVVGNIGDQVFGDVLRTTMYGGNTAEQLDKPMIIELAVAAMEELVRMAQIQQPLWLHGPDDSPEFLNAEEYLHSFPRGIGEKPVDWKSEASRETGLVIMNHSALVEILMDVNQWSNMFSGLVSRAITLDVLSTGVAGNYNGALQLMTAELHVLSPLVPTREVFFLRYCKLHAEGIWAVVDVSLDHLRPSSVIRCRRRPSGCLIQEMPNGYSKVTWVEHIEVDDKSVHNLYKPLLESGLAFGAKRWVATLDRQCERLASVMATNIPPGDVGVITSQEGRRSMLKLAERMVISFCSGVSASTAQTWTTLSGTGDDDVRVMTRKSIDDPGRPPGIVLSAATSFWLPVTPKTLFDFLRNENSRNQWDILSNGGVVQEMAHIANGRDPGNCVSLLRVNSANTNQSNMLIIQESCTDSTGSLVVYAPVDAVAMNVVLNGGDPEYVALLPSGFAIFPDKQQSGSLLTVAFQILVDSVPTAKLSLGSVATVNNLIACTVDRIKAAVVTSSCQ
ncbi:Homeobox-leucine zipper protein PROTODERMAL FACTOR 2 [Ranunculus cassubicifolius]